MLQQSTTRCRNAVVATEYDSLQQRGRLEGERRTEGERREFLSNRQRSLHVDHLLSDSLTLLYQICHPHFLLTILEKNGTHTPWFLWFADQHPPVRNFREKISTEVVYGVSSYARDDSYPRTSALRPMQNTIFHLTTCLHTTTLENLTGIEKFCTADPILVPMQQQPAAMWRTMASQSVYF